MLQDIPIAVDSVLHSDFWEGFHLAVFLHPSATCHLPSRSLFIPYTLMLTSLGSVLITLPTHDAFLGLFDTHPAALWLSSLPSAPDKYTQWLIEDVHLIVPLSVRFSMWTNLVLSRQAASSSTRSSYLCSVIFYFVGQVRNPGTILDFFSSFTYLSEAPDASFFHPYHVLTLVPHYF